MMVKFNGIVLSVLLYQSFATEIIPVRRFLCDNQGVILICRDTYHVVNGRIFVPQQQDASFTFNKFLPPFGYLPQFNTVFYNMTITNISISVTFIFTDPVSVNGGNLQCGNQIFYFDFENRDQAPIELILTPHGNDDFLVTWRPVDESNRSLYEVTVSPPPLHGPHVITNTTSLILTLDTNTQYNITVATTGCTRILNTTFTIGTCSVHNLRNTMVQYIANATNQFYAIVTCETGCENQYILNCGINGEWSNNMSNICTSQIDYQTTNKNSVHWSPEGCAEPSHHIGLSITEFIIIVIGIIVACSLLMFSLGFLSGVKFTKTINNKTTQKDGRLTSTSGPLYDEEQLNEAVPPIDLSSNVAYLSTT